MRISDWSSDVCSSDLTIIHDNRSSRSATYTSRTASNMRILKPRDNRVLSRFFLHARTPRKERCGAGRLSHENGSCTVALTFTHASLIRQEDTLTCPHRKTDTRGKGETVSGKPGG